MRVGEAVAMVVADTFTAALDAAEQVAVEYEELPSVIDARAALGPDAPQLYEMIANNPALDWPGPVDDPANVEAIEQIIQSARVCCARDGDASAHGDGTDGNARGGTASYDAKTERYTLRVCSQGAGPMRDMLRRDHGHRHEARCA